jgi:predicted alpha/beta-hydrolase family hydrolase
METIKKAKQSRVSISNIAGRSAAVAGILVQPIEAKALLVLAHGAGAGMDHSFMNDLAASLSDEGIASLRFQFHFMEDGSKRPDSPKLATATVAAAVQWAVDQGLDLPVFVGGKSFGGRMATTAAALGLIEAVKGIVCYGFPLHQAKAPSVERAKHLQDVRLPMLFLQGTRDALADLSLMAKVSAELRLGKMHVIDGADHSFAVLKRSGRSGSDVLLELSRETRLFCQEQL